VNVALLRCGPPAAGDELLNPPLGLLYLGAVLRERGHHVLVVDLKLQPAEFDAPAHLRPFAPDAIGLSAFSPDAADLARVARVLRNEFPQIPLIVGGPHATSDPAGALGDGVIDYAVVGEGEVTFAELLDRLPDDAADVPGVVTRRNGELRRASAREPISDLDTLPYPAWDMIDVAAFRRFHGATPVGKRPYMPVFTSRGCPFGCTYCHRIFGKTFRGRSAQSVVGEIVVLREQFGIETIEICDDIFNLQPERAIAICDGIAARAPGTRLSFPNGLRVDVMTPEVLAAMKRAGAYFISYAVETATPRLQKMVCKNVDLDKARAMIARTVQAGIFTNGFFMMGFPTETEADVRRTIDFALSTRLHSMSAYIFVPFPNSEIYAQLAGQLTGLSAPEHFDYHTGSVNVSRVPTVRLAWLRRWMYLAFYFGRVRVLRTLWAHPDKASLPRLAWIMVKRLWQGMGRSG
jgi:radical SAM superfamily enzyme YgiQ (UPF0313 family)